jgi:DNA-binding response OmpR family regulator
MKLLLLEIDPELAEITNNYLVDNNFLVTTISDGEEAENLIYSNNYDLLVLSISQSSINALDIAKRMTENNLIIPTVFLSDSKTIDELQKAYHFGAKDFIRKPFLLEELLIRIDYIKKDLFIDSSKLMYITDSITFNSLNMSICKDDKELFLPKKESEVLKYFLLNKNRIISIEELILQVWGYEGEPSISTIRTYIKNIRKNINKESIQTIKGLGYIFII